MQSDIPMKTEINDETLAVRSKQLFTVTVKHTEAPAKKEVAFTADELRSVSLSMAIKRSEGEVMVVDGPFIETKELIAG